MLTTILNHISLQGLIWLILLAPLITSAINWILSVFNCRFGWKNSSPFASFFGVLGPMTSFLSAGIVFWVLTGLEGVEPSAITGPLFKWITFSGWVVEFGLKVDQLSMIMALVITGVGSLIHMYSIGYMHGDDGYSRYFAELNLFLFFMLLLVLADNLLLMFVGWEGVGLCSYLLIGYWFDDPAKAAAGKKAFVVNRIGDFAFIVGIFFIWKSLANQQVVGLNALSFETIERNTAFLIPVATTVCVAFFIGACGKSAQIPLYVWLPDAMAGPTPVSALIHAATMVTAGVYMVARLNFLYILSPFAMQMIAYVGAGTALFAALIGLAQNDIKKVLAYSTISQLGYMFVAEGVGAFSAGIFHLVTHAFFKAALFLCAGSVIHALHGEQDLFKMGGLKKYLPGTFGVFFVAALAISGIWPFSGFFSKDEILWQLYSRGYIGLWLIGFITAGITSFYIFRLIALTFFGKTKIPEEKRGRIHESSVSMLIPLVLLGVLSFAGGWMKTAFNSFLEPKFAESFFDTEGPHKNIEHILAVISVLWAAHWAFVAWILYVQKPDWPRAAATKFRNIYKLLANKFYVDELYDFVIVRPIKWISTNVLWKGLDSSLIDNVCVNGAPRCVGLAGRIIQTAQTGLVPHYIFFIIVGLSAMIVWLVL